VLPTNKHRTEKTMSKRFHVHLHVDDLAQSVVFYNKLFAAQPAREETDYAKWMLDDPPVNFAISSWGSQPGIDHLGIQTDNAAELGELRARAEAAELSPAIEDETVCCYARSDKHWVTDPQGIAWEHFHTLANVPTFSRQAKSASEACCPSVAKPRGQPVGVAVKASSACC
jgi:catechol-2,3-dioxygenase